MINGIFFIFLLLNRSARIKNLLEQKEQLIEKMEAHEKVRLHRIKKSLLKGKLVLVGDGLYETDKYNDCGEYHRVATITTESRRARKDCPHKTILSKTPTPTSSSPVCLLLLFKLAYVYSNNYFSNRLADNLQTVLWYQIKQVQLNQIL